MSDESKPRVLYLHGFEENATSPKPMDVAAIATLDCPALDVWLTRRNSPLLHAVVSSAAGRCLAAAVLAGQLVARVWPLLASGSRLSWRSCGGVTCLCFALAAFVARRGLLAAGIGTSYARTVQIAVERVALAKKTSRPYDAVVGFSWGGAIACELLQRGIWHGPTVLLAPAHKKLGELMQPPTGAANCFSSNLDSLPRDVAEQVVVIQSRADQIVPFRDSEELCEANGFELVAVDGEAHKMWGICGEGGPLRSALTRVLSGRHRPSRL